MKRAEFFKFNKTKVINSVVMESNPTPSQVDPTQAQTGRDMIFNPKPIRYRGGYTNGVKVEDMRVFDNPNADKFDVMREAKMVSQEVRDNYQRMQKDESAKKN